MKIVECLPFDSCRKCANCVLKTNVETIFDPGGTSRKFMIVECKKEKVCKEIRNQ